MKVGGKQFRGFHKMEELGTLCQLLLLSLLLLKPCSSLIVLANKDVSNIASYFSHNLYFLKKKQ